ncbi:hypoxanthine phosphoribosyltransferase [Bradyrhizobium sp. LB9.1b]
MDESADLPTVSHKYAVAENHSIHIPIADAVSLSRLVAQRIVGQIGKPDLIVGLANGATLLTTVCGQELGVPTHMVFVRRQHSRYKQTLLTLKEFLHVPSSWILAGPLRYLWTAFQELFSKVEAAADTFQFRVQDLHVVVVDDCIVTGNSIRYVSERLAALGAKQVTTAAICWTEEEWGGKMKQAPNVYVTRKIQWYPWSNNSDYWQDYREWLRARNIRHLA